MSEHLDDDLPAGTNGSGGNSYGPISDDDLNELRRSRDDANAQLARERTNRARIERERDEARGQMHSAVEERWRAEEEALDGSLSASESEADGLEARIAQLNADGAFAEAAKASRQLSKLEAQIAQIGQRKQWLTETREQQKQQAQRQPPRRQGGDVSVDLTSYSDRQRQWIEQDHPEYLTDAKFRQRVAAAHYAAVAEGSDIDSDDYFASIEDKIAGSSKARREPELGEEAPEQRPRRDSNGALAVQRRAPNGAARQGEVRLSPDQREAADTVMSDVPVDDHMVNGVLQPGRYRRYARNLARLRQEGRLQ